MFKFGPLKKLAPKKVRLLLVVLIILVLASGGLGYAFWFNKSDDNVNTTGTSQADGDTAFATPTPTPTATSTPSNQIPTPTPTPAAATPTPIIFAVTGVTASADTQTVCTGVFREVSFEGTIATNAAGTVSYHWLGSDGGITSGAPLNFAGAGSQTVTTSWGSTWGNPLPAMNQPSIFERFLSLFEGRAYALPFPDPVTFWEQLVVTSPNAISSNQASFVSSPYYCSPT
jgi:hypothetical protein